MKYSFLILFCVALLIGATTITSCQDNPTRSSQPENNFPHSVGNTWTYAVVDSAKQDTFNVNVSIVGTATLSNGTQAKIWQYQWPDKVDTNYVQIEGPNVLIHNGRNVDKSYTTIYLEFPLTTSQKWGKAADSSHVVAQKDITVPAGTFNLTYQMTRYRQSYNYHVRENYWFKPGVGLIKLYRNKFNLGPPTVRNWEPLDYSVKD